MGSGIAQVAATAGYETIVRDVSNEVLNRAAPASRSRLPSWSKKESSSPQTGTPRSSD